MRRSLVALPYSLLSRIFIETEFFPTEYFSINLVSLSSRNSSLKNSLNFKWCFFRCCHGRIPKLIDKKTMNSKELHLKHYCFSRLFRNITQIARDNIIQNYRGRCSVYSKLINLIFTKDKLGNFQQQARIFTCNKNFTKPEISNASKASRYA